MTIEWTKDYDLNLEHKNIAKAHVFKHVDNTYFASCLYWENEEGRLLRTKNEKRAKAILHEKTNAETEDEAIEKIKKWAKERYGEKVIMEEKK